LCLLEKGSLLEIDNTKIIGVSTRDAILKKYPDLADKLPEDRGPEWSFIKMDGNQLFNILMQHEEDR